ncbi:hypothetical protein [Saccharopolyspora hattusasensis]
MPIVTWWEEAEHDGQVGPEVQEVPGLVPHPPSSGPRGGGADHDEQ